MATIHWLCVQRPNDKNNKFNPKSNKKIMKIINIFNKVHATTRLAFLIYLLSAHVTRINAEESTSTTSVAFSHSHSATVEHIAAHKPNLATSSTQPERNTLIDDEIEHKKIAGHDANQPHIRKKRLIWITDDGRLALPPGTSLTITPTLALPLIRHPPEGFFSNISISFPLTIDFDKLGLTDNQNPLGDFPPLFARSFGHAAGEMVGNYVARYLHYKRKRDLDDQSDRNAAPTITKLPPELPDRFQHIFHGGERVMLYVFIEDFLTTFGMDGRACLLRTICEIHSRSLQHYGVFGEMAKLFLTVTKSPFSHLIPEYVRAQEIGEGRQAPGECYPYHKACPKSIFKAIQNHKYSQQQNQEYHEENVEEVETYRPLGEKRLPDSDTQNEIGNRRDSLYPQSLSM